MSSRPDHSPSGNFFLQLFERERAGDDYLLKFRFYYRSGKFLKFARARFRPPSLLLPPRSSGRKATAPLLSGVGTAKKGANAAAEVKKHFILTIQRPPLSCFRLLPPVYKNTSILCLCSLSVVFCDFGADGRQKKKTQKTKNHQVLLRWSASAASPLSPPLLLLLLRWKQRSPRCPTGP